MINVLAKVHHEFPNDAKSRTREWPPFKVYTNQEHRTSVPVCAQWSTALTTSFFFRCLYPLGADLSGQGLPISVGLMKLLYENSIIWGRNAGLQGCTIILSCDRKNRFGESEKRRADTKNFDIVHHIKTVLTHLLHTQVPTVWNTVIMPLRTPRQEQLSRLS